MGKVKDLTGQRFGRLTVIERSGFAKGRNALWKCQCDCGKIVTVRGSYLTCGDTKSCGCLKLELITHLTASHNMSGTKIFWTWAGMLSRCFNNRAKKFARYGGRGITVCDEWRNDFMTFYNYVSKLEHFGEEGYSLDRIDNDGNYEPGNVRWATAHEQSCNKSDIILVEYNGEKVCLGEAARRAGVKYSALYARYHKGIRGAELFAKFKPRVIIVEYHGKELPLKEAAKLSGINYNTLSGRYRNGKRGEELFS